MGKPPLKEMLLDNVYFDTCVYHRPGIELLLKVIPADNILFASKSLARCETSTRRPGHYDDETLHRLDRVAQCSDRHKILHDNVSRVYPLPGTRRWINREQG